jgi:hypothetical protein
VNSSPGTVVRGDAPFLSKKPSLGLGDRQIAKLSVVEASRQRELARGFAFASAQQLPSRIVVHFIQSLAECRNLSVACATGERTIGSEGPSV